MFAEGKDKPGPAQRGDRGCGKKKDSKATRDTRLVVFGTSASPATITQRFGGNMDFFLNAVSWVMEDESLISIRARKKVPARSSFRRSKARLSSW